MAGSEGCNFLLPYAWVADSTASCHGCLSCRSRLLRRDDSAVKVVASLAYTHIENTFRDSFYIFSPRGNLLHFKTSCIISVLFSTNCLFHNFKFFL